MTTRQYTIEEARRELVSARTFGREPASWALSLAQEVRRVDESELDTLDDLAFGRPKGLPEVEDPMEANFRLAGLCEASARIAARGLRDGHYFSFEDAAIAQTVFDIERRNGVATPQRISEVARLAEGKSPEDRRDHQTISESDLDALDEAAFGRVVRDIDDRRLAARRGIRP